MQEVDAIDIVFENGEKLTVPYMDVKYLSIGKIEESVRGQNTMQESTFYYQREKTTNYVFIKVRDKEQYARIKKFLDITALKFKSGDTIVDTFKIEWHEESGEVYNFGQRISENGDELAILVDANKDFRKKDQ